MSSLLPHTTVTPGTLSFTALSSTLTTTSIRPTRVALSAALILSKPLLFNQFKIIPFACALLYFSQNTKTYKCIFKISQLPNESGHQDHLCSNKKLKFPQPYEIALAEH